MVAAEGRLIGGRYRLEGRLGAGGMGTVWAGHDVLVDRQVAVKEAFAGEEPSRVERILREARAAARVRHPAVVTVHDVVIEDGRPWIVMERVHGESLATLLDRETALAERDAARIALPVAEALAAAHAGGVLHRDVKPGNVLLGSDGRVVLTDFGIAYIAGEETLTRAGEFVGSLAYAAPERMGGRRPGPASDLWSLGVLLFQMVEGWSPFQRVSMEATVAAVVTAEPPSVLRAVELGPLIAELLAKEPEQRPTPERVAAVLREVAGPEGVSGAAREQRAGRAEAPTVERRRLPARRLWLAAAAIAVALALVPVGIAALKDEPGSPTHGGSSGRSPRPSVSSDPGPTATPPAAQNAGKGYVRVQEKSFAVDVPKGWSRHARNADGQFRFTKGDYELIVVPGRDRAADTAGDPMTYQRESEPELAPFRDSTWATSSGMRSAKIGDTERADGQFTWATDTGSQVFVSNSAVLIGGRYHLLLVIGPEEARETVTRTQKKAMESYTPAK
ncbi:serine/threonine-protein kinase [Streptomyces sp. NBC_01304]|uniref:serine/threonine-protein kinase n=1 Tax=Streptomyces sp. NBC_01304 TaxID=2903818 RepID=UPI003FA3B2DD